MADAITHNGFLYKSIQFSSFGLFVNEPDHFKKWTMFNLFAINHTMERFSVGPEQIACVCQENGRKLKRLIPVLEFTARYMSHLRAHQPASDRLADGSGCASEST
jgi:hypothetical protein